MRDWLVAGSWKLVAGLLAASYLLPATSFAQIDPRGDWRTLRTDHFNLHVRSEHLAIGRAAAVEAESAYVALAARLRPPRGRIDVVVADNIDFSNGFATVYPRPRVVIYAVPPAGDLQLGMYDRWLRLVLTHELAHVFQLDLARGWWGLGRKVLGRAPFLFPNIYAPAWIIEGTAVWYESELTGAGRRSGSFHRTVVAAEAAERSGMSVSEASIGSAAWPGGIRGYAWGSEFFAAANDSTLPSFIRRSAGALLPWVQLSSSFKGASGVSIGNAWSRRAGAALVAAQTDGARPIVRGLRVLVTPRLAPDGRRLLLAHNDGRDATRLVTIDLATRERRELARLNEVETVAWQNDTTMLVSQLDFVDAYNVRSDLWRITGSRQSAVGSRGEERLTTGARILSLDVRGDTIVAVRVVPGGTELVMLTPQERVLRRSTPGFDWASPRFSPDGRTIAAVLVRNGQHDIIILGSDGGSTSIVVDSVRDLTPAFSPDGETLTWSREIDGVPQIVSMRWREAPARLRVLTDEPFGAYAPAPGRDSTWYLAYHADGYALAAAPNTGRDAELRYQQPGAPQVVRADTSLRDRRYSSFPALLPSYWLPLAFASEGGTWLGVLTSGSDPLVRHNYVGSLEFGTGLYRGQWRATLGYTRTGPGTSLLDASFTRSRQAFIADSLGTVRCCLPDEAANAGITFVRRRVRAQSNLRLGATFDRDGLRERAGGLVTAAWSRVITPAMAISAQEGARLSAQLRVRRRLDAPLAAADIAMRATAYRSFGRAGFARPVSALRLAAGTVIGNDNLAYNVGGESGGAVSLVPGLPPLGSIRSYPVRGYAGGFLAGRHVATLSLEQRAPLAHVGRNLGLLPVGLEHLSATAFADLGVAYSRQYCGTGSDGRCSMGIASVGAELGTMFMVGYDLPLLARVGAGVRLKHATGLGAYATVGSSF